MTQSEQVPSADVVERVARAIADYVAFRPWEHMADDRSDLRGKIKDGFDVNEPTKNDCMEAARAAIAAMPTSTTQPEAHDTVERDLVAENVALREALRIASEAITEMFRYYDGGETRGSYDGKPERNQLRKAGYTIAAALRTPATGEDTAHG